MESKNQNPKKVKVFVAGSIALKEERKAIRDLFMSINNAVDGFMFFFVKAYDDFGASGQQHNYDAYIQEADYVIFLIEQVKGSGKYTMKEFDVARKAQEKNKQNKPEILVFYRQIHELIPQPDLILVCENLKHYYSLYSDVEDLRSQLLYKMFIDVVKAQNQKINELLELADADIKEDSDFNAKSDKVTPVSGEIEQISTFIEDLSPSITDGEAIECPESSRSVVIDGVKELHASLINATKSILTMVQDLADTGDLSFPKQMAVIAELMETMRMASVILPKHIYAEIENFAINYPQKGFNTVLSVLRKRIKEGVTSLDASDLTALHADLLKAMPVDETQDQLNALIRTLQDYCNNLEA